MSFKRYLSLLLVCILVICSSNSVFAITNNANTDVDSINNLRITAEDIKIDSSTAILREYKDNKTIIQPGNSNFSNEKSGSAFAVPSNRAPIADLRYAILNPSSLSPEGYLTTNTEVAWLWSYNGTNFTYDPDGDAIVNMEVGGIPSSAITAYATDNNNNRIGFIVKIPASGTYTMTFRCQDEHGLWSNVWSNALYIAKPTPPRTKAIACGTYHTVALKEDGTVWAWGWNSDGQLGDGTTFDRSTPVQVTGLTGVKAISCGIRNTYALKEDGTVWAWGYNGYGQLGDGTTTSKTTPVQVTGLTGVKALARGGGLIWHTLALKEDGTVWAWGSNGSGQLGDGTTTSRTTPVQVTGLTRVKYIVCGQYNSMAITEDGSVWGWGSNGDGQLGDGTTTGRTTPVQVTGFYGATSIGCGDIHTVALKTDGTVWTCGNNYWWGLGYGTNTDKKYVPNQVSALSNVRDVIAAYFHTAALKTDGTVWAWGADSFDQLANGASIKRYPTQITGITGVKNIACGAYHTVALKEDGTVWTWGQNDKGQLGNGTTTNKYDTPIKVTSLN